MGVGLATKGRPKGLLKFTRDDYDEAVRDFCLFSTAAHTNATYAAYDVWVKQELVAGRERPSGASIRNIYGTWLDAVRAVQE
jgi:hypothetical protein